MQDLLKDYLVEHIEKDKMHFSLTCAVCGSLWKSSVISVSAQGSHNLDTVDSLREEAKSHNRMCTFCGRPVCLNCFEDVKGIFLCKQCGQRLRTRIDIK